MYYLSATLTLLALGAQTAFSSKELELLVVVSSRRSARNPIWVLLRIASASPHGSVSPATLPFLFSRHALISRGLPPTHYTTKNSLDFLFLI